VAIINDQFFGDISGRLGSLSFSRNKSGKTVSNAVSRSSFSGNDSISNKQRFQEAVMLYKGLTQGEREAIGNRLKTRYRNLSAFNYFIKLYIKKGWDYTREWIDEIMSVTVLWKNIEGDPSEAPDLVAQIEGQIIDHIINNNDLGETNPQFAPSVISVKNYVDSHTPASPVIDDSTLLCTDPVKAPSVRSVKSYVDSHAPASPVIDDSTLSSADPVKAPSVRSVKSYVDSHVIPAILKTVKLSLTRSQCLNLISSPIDIVPAVSGKFLIPLQAWAIPHFTYASPHTLAMQIGTTPGGTSILSQSNVNQAELINPLLVQTVTGWSLSKLTLHGLGSIVITANPFTCDIYLAYLEITL
jgi:hypothetical protein